jgi:hypothetical protein
MSIALIVIEDGRDTYHDEAIISATHALPMREFDQHIWIDDHEHELGFAGAIQSAWQQVETDWVFHLEADFTFAAPVPLVRMIAVLGRHPELAQIVLKRQPCNAIEAAAGGLVEVAPDDFTEVREGDDVWTEHRKWWSTNPGVYSSRFCRLGWPQVPQSEGIFTHQLLRDPLLRFAMWGTKFASPLVEHIGHDRAGVGY